MSTTETTSPIRSRWFQIPAIWLAMLCLLVSILGCVANIVIALQNDNGAMDELAPASRFQLPPPELEQDGSTSVLP